MSSIFPIVFRLPLSVRWRDLDILNHVNNANFFTYVEEARAKWLGGVKEAWTVGEAVPVLSSAQMDFKGPVGWPGDVEVVLLTERVGESSLTVRHEIHVVKAGQPGKRRLAAEGMVRLVWIDPRTGKPVPLPETVREAAGRSIEAV